MAGGSTVLASAVERRRVWKLIWWAFVLRAAVAVTLHYAGVSNRLAPDEDLYSAVGRALALYWAGELFAPPERVASDAPFAYFYFNAVSYSIFGSFLPLKLVNSWLGALVCLYVHHLAEALYGPKVAWRSAVLVAFFPSLVLWSTLNIRDVWIQFLLIFLSWKCYQVVIEYSTLALVQVLGAIALVSAFRPYLFLATAIPTVVAVLIGKRRGQIARNVGLAAVAGAVAIFLAQQGAAAKALGEMDLESLAQKRRYLATGAGSGFEESADISTPEKALAFLPRGLLFFWFSPFPWQLRSPLQMLSMPEMLVLYGLTPAIIRGVGRTIRHRLREAMQVLLLTALLTLSYALGSGNVGTLYRHRAQSLVFYLMFGAAGLRKALGQPQLAQHRTMAGVPAS